MSASISGTVKDATGAVTPGVQVTVRNVETGVARTIQTDSAGHFLVSNIPPGSYEVQAELTGFQTEVRRGITLTLGREAVVDVTLAVGQVQEQVVVTGEAPLVDTSSAAVAGLVDQQQVAELPLNGRSLTQLATLQPGVLFYRASNATTGLGEYMVISGSRTRSNNFLLNGTNVQNFFGKSPSGASGTQLGVEAVREFTVLTSSYSAEYGRSAGGVVNAITKSGTNAFHGTLFEYHRNDNLDAAKWEANAFGGGLKPEFKRNQFGGNLGGPIRRDKTFFFANAELLRERLGETQTRSFPTAAARQGSLPGRPSFPVAAAVKPYLDLLPLPTGQDLGDGTGRYSFASTRPTDEEYVHARMDHNFSESDSVFGSYVYDNSEQSTVGFLPSLVRGITPYRNQYVTLEASHIFTPTLLNTAHFGFNRSRADNTFECDEGMARLSFVPGGKCFNFQGGGFSVPGHPLGPRLQTLNSFQTFDTVFWTRGTHSFKFGGYFERIQNNGQQQSSPFGVYNVTNLENFLRANFRYFEALLAGLNIQRGMRQKLFAFFGNDSIRLRPNLTVNLGVRYEFITVPTEVNGKLSNIDTLSSPARVGEPYFDNPSLLNFGPRVGIAWALGSKQDTSVRAGFGIFYEQLLHQEWNSTPFRTPPFYNIGRITSTATNPVSFPNAYDLLLAGNVPPDFSSFVFGIDGNPPQPYVMQYNLSVQRQLPRQMVVLLAYVGSVGRHIGRLVDNQAVPTIQTDGRIFFSPDSRRRNANFQEIRHRTYDTTSAYNAMQLGVRRRLAQGIGFQLSYTWSKTLDMLSDNAGTGDLFNDTVFATIKEFPALDKGRSAFDAHQLVSANFTLDLPFGKNLSGVPAKLAGGWQTQAIVSLQSGLPTAVLLGFDNARFQSTRNQGRPNLNPGFNAENTVLGPPDKTKDPNGRYLDPNAFSLPAPGFLGNLGRGVFSGPGLAALDFSVLKKTALTESVNLEFRSEFFNLLNRANFSSPAQTVYNAAGQTTPIGNFSTITETLTTARQIQFALKLAF